MKKFPLLIILMVAGVFLSSGVKAENGVASLSGLAVVIDRFELKDEKGQWHVVIEPDKKVDLSEKNFYFSFFNNGRVPEGQYQNFRLTVSDKDVSGKNRITSMTAKNDLLTTLKINKTSFVGVELQVISGSVDFPIKEIDFIEVTVDDNTVKLTTDNILKQR